jgi:hypothetical protein
MVCALAAGHKAATSARKTSGQFFCRPLPAEAMEMLAHGRSWEEMEKLRIPACSWWQVRTGDSDEMRWSGGIPEFGARIAQK